MSDTGKGIPRDPDMLDIVLREDWERLPAGYSKNISRAAARREVHRLRNEATKAALMMGLRDARDSGRPVLIQSHGSEDEQ